MLNRKPLGHVCCRPERTEALQCSVRRVMVILAVCLVGGVSCCHARSEGMPMHESISLDRMIELVHDGKQRMFLEKFREKLQKDDTTFVTDHGDHYQIHVVHPCGFDCLGASECYTLDKKTGKVKMKSHSHPRKIRVTGPIPLTEEDLKAFDGLPR